jgi:hypothetical protein
MSLPVINTPTYELKLPSTKELITYRPFLVKEEKILLIAMEEENEANTINAVRTIVNNCTFEKLDVHSLAMFDLEYIFLRVRAKSVGEVVTVNLLSPDDNKTYVKVDIDLESVEVKFDKKHKKKIKLTDEIILEMSYPNLDLLSASGDLGQADQIFGMIGQCVERIYDGETIYERADFTQKELDVFLESLNTKQFEEVQEFFNTMPKISHDVEFTNPKTKKKNKITLEGMQSFFG